MTPAEFWIAVWAWLSGALVGFGVGVYAVRWSVRRAFRQAVREEER